jgi:hypothetical protein
MRAMHHQVSFLKSILYNFYRTYIYREGNMYLPLSNQHSGTAPVAQSRE